MIVNVVCSALKLGLLVFILLVFGVVENSRVAAQSGSVKPIIAQTEGNGGEPVKWALAVHGGAGGNPAKWTDSQKAAREKGLAEALEVGRQVLASGGTALDAVERVVRVLEDNPAFNAGRGAVLTSEKNAELDAAIMDGSQRACGAVASITTARNPISLARLVMSETRHVLLIGSGADAFAARQGVELVSQDYFKLKPDEEDLSLYRNRSGHYLGTVGCVALDKDGNLAAGTSTGGLGGKMPGRVGDSPIFGAGTFADNGTCAISGTGVGEEYIRNVIAYDVSAQMRYAGRSITEAVRVAMRETLKEDTGGLIAVGYDGTIVLEHNTPGMTCGAANSAGRFDVMLSVPK